MKMSLKKVAVGGVHLYLVISEDDKDDGDKNDDALAREGIFPRAVVGND